MWREHMMSFDCNECVHEVEKICQKLYFSSTELIVGTLLCITFTLLDGYRNYSSAVRQKETICGSGQRLSFL